MTRSKTARNKTPHITAVLAGKTRPASEHEAHFLKFMRTYPKFWPEFVRIALTMQSLGHTRYSADAITHKIRADAHLAGEEMTVNNNHAAYVARLFRETYPEQASMFRFRAVSR